MKKITDYIKRIWKNMILEISVIKLKEELFYLLIICRMEMVFHLSPEPFQAKILAVLIDKQIG